MNTIELCPISIKRINENVARANAYLTVGFLVAYLLTSNVLIIVFLLVDFLLRGLELSQYSPFAIASKKVVQLVARKPKLINAGPKIFAARIGLFFSISILVAALLGLNAVSIVLSVVFGVCALLEAVVGFCLACQIYPFVYKLYYESKLNAIK
jgi:hypothetical protein